MAKRLHKPQWPNDKKFYSRDEEEISNYDYEGTSDTHPISGISSSIKLAHPVDSSKENVELSLEVEIADSLKHLIASPERKNSALLDVTIVRPTDLDFVRGLDTSNTLAFKSSEVRNLIASMEREKQHKKKLIEECKRKAAISKMNTLNEIHETNSKHSLTRNEERELHKRRLKRTENATCTRNNITVMSAPPKCSLHVDYKLDKKHHTANADILKYKVGEAYTNSAPIATLKPLVGEIKESLKHLEASISQIGDRSSKNSAIKCYEERFVSTSDSNPSNNILHCKHDKNHYPPGVLQDERLFTHQVYAAAGNYDKLKNLLACQNSERRDQDNEKPCNCHHCGMVSLLIESQKRPIMSPLPTKKADAGWPRNDNHMKIQKPDHEMLRMTRKEMSKSPHPDKMKVSDDHFWIIRDLASRLEALEIRVAAQEQRAVPRDYFKRIINKLWHRHNSDSLHTMSISNLDRTQRVKDHSTQYSMENEENMLKMKKEPKTVKHRNVQIQQNTKRNFCVNPILLTQIDLEHQTRSNDSQENESSKNVGTKTMNAISEFFKKSEPNRKSGETNIPKEKSSAMDSFWRWGEEIIKPGFDLKIKIMSLLDEQFQNIKIMKESDDKGTASKKSDFKMKSPKSSSVKTNAVKMSLPKTNPSKTDLPKIILTKPDIPKTANLRQNGTTPENLFEAPLPFEDKEISKNAKQTKNEENVTIPDSSSRTLKRMLDMMSEKIYNDHVKPTVDAIKQEQKSFNNENTKQIYNIKAAMDAALCKITTKEINMFKTPNTNEPKCEGRKWRKDVFEALEVPTTIKNIEGDLYDHSKSPKLSKKSAIPVRVNNPSPTDSTSAKNSKCIENRRSLIPCLKSPVKDGSDCKAQSQDNKPAKGTDKIQKRERYELQHKKTSPRKHDTQHAPDSAKSKKDNKYVQVKYINPKVERWNEESGASIQTEASEENKQVMLTAKSNKCEKLRDSNTEEKRRISHKHSVTDKLAFLTKLTRAEMGNTEIWNNILKQAKNHCRSKQDTVIIQIPTKTHYKHHDTGITEVEFTIEDIQKLVNSSKLDASVDIKPQESIESNNMESFLLIRSRKILEEVHKRLENTFKKNKYEAAALNKI